ncbi:hypothetical protein FFF34_005460 [Inquilinus sp. KBS0705]|nr:hypothetical protein FFF34_005460 [Inquilinus sp. KBS0705]
MKYLLVFALLLCISCATERPLYKPGDRVYHVRYSQYFTIDSLHMRPGSRVVFYYATRTDGVKYKWLPQRSIEKFWRKDFRY